MKDQWVTLLGIGVPAMFLALGWLVSASQNRRQWSRDRRAEIYVAVLEDPEALTTNRSFEARLQAYGSPDVVRHARALANELRVFKLNDALRRDIAADRRKVIAAEMKAALSNFDGDSAAYLKALQQATEDAKQKEEEYEDSVRDAVERRYKRHRELVSKHGTALLTEIRRELGTDSFFRHSWRRVKKMVS